MIGIARPMGINTDKIDPVIPDGNHGIRLPRPDPMALFVQFKDMDDMISQGNPAKEPERGEVLQEGEDLLLPLPEKLLFSTTRTCLIPIVPHCFSHRLL